MKPDDKLASLGKRLEAKKRKLESENESEASHYSSFNVFADLAGGVVAGLIMGLVMDKIFGTKPIFLVSCLLIGTVSGFYVVYKKVVR